LVTLLADNGKTSFVFQTAVFCFTQKCRGPVLLPSGTAESKTGGIRAGKLFCLFFFEHVFAYAAQRADEIVRDIFPFSAGRNAVVRRALRLIIDITAYAANILFHAFYSFFMF